MPNFLISSSLKSGFLNSKGLAPDLFNIK
jgi:hypothetical protein